MFFVYKYIKINFFYFLKNIFDIYTLKQYKNIKKIFFFLDVLCMAIIMQEGREEPRTKMNASGSV
jgi:hypothetical protein